MMWLVFGCVWVLASCVIAMLPMRKQYLPGVMLLVAAPFLIWALFDQLGWLVGCFALFAFASMYRNPLVYMVRRAMGQRPEIPK